MTEDQVDVVKLTECPHCARPPGKPHADTCPRYVAPAVKP